MSPELVTRLERACSQIFLVRVRNAHFPMSIALLRCSEEYLPNPMNRPSARGPLAFGWWRAEIFKRSPDDRPSRRGHVRRRWNLRENGRPLNTDESGFHPLHTVECFDFSQLAV